MLSVRKRQFSQVLSNMSQMGDREHIRQGDHKEFFNTRPPLRPPSVPPEILENKAQLPTLPHCATLVITD